MMRAKIRKIKKKVSGLTHEDWLVITGFIVIAGVGVVKLFCDFGGAEQRAMTNESEIARLTRDLDDRLDEQATIIDKQARQIRAFKSFLIGRCQE